MSRPLPAPVEHYLKELELQLKKRCGVFVEETLSDAREYLVTDYDALMHSEPGLGEKAIFDHFVENFGAPVLVASTYGFSESPDKRKGNAPGWRIACCHCNFSVPATEAGIIRIHASSKHKYIGAKCGNCKCRRWFHVIKDMELTNLTEELSMAKTPEELRTAMHRPVQTIRAILLLTVCSILLMYLVIGGVLWIFLPRKQAGPTSNFELRQVAASKTNEELPFKQLPKGWKVEKDIAVPVAKFAAKMPVPLKDLHNTFLSYEGESVQINSLLCGSESDAEKLRQTLAKGKPNPRFVCRKKMWVFELAVRDTKAVKVALQARDQLELNPKEATYRVQVQVAPYSKGDAGEANQFFNAFLRLKNADEKARKDLEELASKFEFANRLSVRLYGQGEKGSEWTTQPAAKRTSKLSSTLDFEWQELPKTLKVPVVELSGRIQSKYLATSPASPGDRDANLRSTSRWPTEEARIKKISDDLLRGATDDREKVERILNWMSDGKAFRFGGDVVGSRYGTLKALEQGYGHCWDFSDLFITMARSSGIPSRQVLGWLDGSQGHVWAEVLMKDGWMAVDPNTGLPCGSDYIPFQVTSDGEVSWMFLAIPEISRE